MKPGRQMGLEKDQGRKAKGLHQVLSTGVNQGGVASGWGLCQEPRGAGSETTAGVQPSWPECVSLARLKHDGAAARVLYLPTRKGAIRSKGGLRGGGL